MTTKSNIETKPFILSAASIRRVERAVIIASGKQIELEDLPEAISLRASEAFAQARHERAKAASEGRSINLEVDFPATMDEIEKQAIELALDYTSGDK